MGKFGWLLEDEEWLGEFWVAGHQDDHVPGLVRYSAQRGLVAKVRYCGFVFPDHWTTPRNDGNSRTLHGWSASTGPLTLLGSKALSSGGFRNGVATRSIWSGAAVCGGHVDDETRFRGMRFEANNLGEFFHSQHFMLADTLSAIPVLGGDHASPEKPACGGQCAFSVSIEKSAEGQLVPEPASVFRLDKTNDGAFIDDLNAAIQGVMKTHDRQWIATKGDVIYRVLIEARTALGATFSEFKHVMFQVCGLLSLLCLKPVRPMRVSIGPLPEDDSTQKPRFLPVFVSQLLSDRLLRSIRRDKDRDLELPMNSDSLVSNYPDVLHRWFAFLEQDLNLIWPTIQHHIDGTPEYLQEFVLLVASMEQCCVLENGPSKNRYDWFVDNYCSDPLKDGFLTYLPSGTREEEIGKSLADLRNCIVHPKKIQEKAFKKYATSLSQGPLYNLSELLFLGLVTYVYRKIGLAEAAIKKFEDGVRRHIITVTEL